jgi:hypothetical protein
MATTPKKCQPLADKLEEQQALLRGFREELISATGAQRAQLQSLIRSLQQLIGETRHSLELCIHPPEPRPNLRAVDVRVWFHADNKAFDATLLITNDGGAPAQHAFKIVFGYLDPSGAYHERNLSVLGALPLQPGDTYPFVFPDIAFEKKQGNVMAPYTFYALVDADDQIQESNEIDNSFQTTKVIRPPRFPHPFPNPDLPLSVQT